MTNKIKKDHFIKGLVRQNVRKGKARIKVISINLNELPINEQGWTNIGIQKKKDGTEFMFSYDDYIKDQKKPEDLLLDILNEEYEPNLSEDFELESRKHENWNNS
tara:strand:- start:111 stop:425 length:315 start_codon:yes stop_codon:yes gene_type:complete